MRRYSRFQNSMRGVWQKCIDLIHKIPPVDDATEWPILDEIVADAFVACISASLRYVHVHYV